MIKLLLTDGARKHVVPAPFRVAAAIILGMLASSAPANTDSLRSVLAARLDSIEMVKQENKRQGLSLDELERQTTLIKDSLVALRQAVARQPAPASAPAAADSDRSAALWPGLLKLVRQVLKPAGPIDWAIIAIGAIALVSGIFLIISVAFASGRKNRRLKRPADRQKTFGGYSAAGRPTAGPAGPAPVREEPDSEEEAVPEDEDEPQTSRLEPADPDDDFDLLRRRVRLDNPRTVTAEPPPRLGGTEQPRAETVPSDVRRQVIAAAADGADIAEISRRFHLSADHVALILKVAAKKK